MKDEAKTSGSNCPVDSKRLKKYLKNPAVWVIVFYCVKGTAVTIAGLAALYLTL